MKVFTIIGAYIEDGKALSDLLGVYTNEDKANQVYNTYIAKEQKFPAYDNITLTWDNVA